MTNKTKHAFRWLSGAVLLFVVLDAAYQFGYGRGYEKGGRDTWNDIMPKIKMKIIDDSTSKEEASTFPGVNTIPAVRYSHATN
jgi:hypothetical protein